MQGSHMEVFGERHHETVKCRHALPQHLLQDMMRNHLKRLHQLEISGTAPSNWDMGLADPGADPGALGGVESSRALPILSSTTEKCSAEQVPPYTKQPLLSAWLVYPIFVM